MTSKHREEVVKIFHGRCLINPAHPGTDVHEIVPKSQDPIGWDRLDNQVLLCHNCHIGKVHKDGARVWKERLIDLRLIWLKKYG